MLKDLRFTDYFLFTQQSLSTFENCPLKFKKRYLENLKWDSFPDDRIKKRLEMGNDFHLIANRYFMGIDSGFDDLTEKSNELSDWVESLKSSFKPERGAKYLPEYKLRMVSGGLKLEANFDLLVLKEDSIEIWDWKTHSGSRNDSKLSEAKRLLDSLQTIVYLFVLKEQSPLVAGSKTECEKISMHYWQPEPAGILAEIKYSRELHEKYREILHEKINRILEYDYTKFQKELFNKHCRYCEFNWFCNNERIDYKSLEEDSSFLDELEWDDIGEKY